MPPRAVAAGDAEKASIIVACEALIRDVHKPRFPPANLTGHVAYCFDVHGEWRAGRYRFLQRYRSLSPETLGKEYDVPFARLDHMGPDNFDIHWMRHTGQWWQVYRGKTLAESMKILAEDPVLLPH